VKFLVDAQLPLALADWLRKMGYAAEHVRNIALHDADDATIREYACGTDAILITKDRDFASVDGGQRAALRVIWVRTGNVSNRVMFQRLEAGWPQVVAHLRNGAQLIELR
jgi:predicted nuclease of predicted toxin-antitoxin system